MLHRLYKTIAALGTGAFVLACIGVLAAGAGVQPEALGEVRTTLANEIQYSLIMLLFAIVIPAAAVLISRITAFIAGIRANKGTGDLSLDQMLEIAGYAYDVKQDIFYSIMDPWQRKLGYCRLYDEACAPFGMIIDCEPVYFEYEGRKWMIELWKGQYDLTAGCEIGIYTGALDVDIPGLFSGTFYNCASNTELLHMSYSLKNKGAELLKREGKHWWLTGFKLGEFAEPSDLLMDVEITLASPSMRDAFINGLRSAGYPGERIKADGNKVNFIFDTPFTEQPLTRSPETDLLIQRKNKLLCDKFQEITEPYNTAPDKLKAIEEQAPELYEKIINIGKSREVYKQYELIKEYLNL